MPVTVHSDKVHELVDASADVEQIATGFTFTEGPIWMPDGSLHFSDMPADKRRRWHPEEGVTVLRDPSNKCNGMTLDNDGNLIVCEHVTSSVVRERPDGARETLATHYDGRELNSPNDVIVASDGSILFTDPTYGRMPGFGVEREQELDFQGVYRIPPGGGEPAAARRRLRPAERALLLARRVAALRQRHRPRAHPGVRGRPGPLALERTRGRRRDRDGRHGDRRARRRDEARRARQHLRDRPEGRLDHLGPRASTSA